MLLNKISEIAEETGYHAVMLEAPEGQRLAKYLAPAIKAVLIRLNRVEKAREYAARAMAALRGFASAFTISIGDVEFGVTQSRPRQTAATLNLIFLNSCWPSDTRRKRRIPASSFSLTKFSISLKKI